MAMLPFTGNALRLGELEQYTDPLPSSEKMPVMFLGHGSPMNAIEENQFVRGWRKVGRDLIKPQAVLCVSAHWETKGTYVTAMKKPRTIYDFGGFPPELYRVEYPAEGSPIVAQQTKELVTKTSIGLDQQWGLDHGCWSVLKHIFPNADIPVIQLSLDYTQPAQYHYELAKELAALRRKGILIIGSGNMVHNLGLVAWDKLNQAGYAFEWATEANEKMKSCIRINDHKSLINYRSMGKAFDLAIPSAEHYLPLLYVLALQEENEELKFFNDEAVAGSLTMTSLKVG